MPDGIPPAVADERGGTGGEGSGEGTSGGTIYSGRIGPNNGRVVHVKLPSPHELFTPLPSFFASTTPSSQSPPATSTGTTAATSASSPVTLGATTKPARAAETKRNPAASLEVSPTTPTTPPVDMSTVSTSSVKSRTPTQRVSRAKKGKRVHACNHQDCDKVYSRSAPCLSLSFFSFSSFPLPPLLPSCSLLSAIYHGKPGKLTSCSKI